MDVWYYSHLLYEWMFLSWLWIWYTQQTRLLPCKCFRFACGFSFQKPPKGGSMCSQMMLSQNNKPTVGWFGNLVLGAPMLSGFHLAPISPCEDMEHTVIRWQGPTAGLSTSKNHHFRSISGLTMVYGRDIYIYITLYNELIDGVYKPTYNWGAHGGTIRLYPQWDKTCNMYSKHGSRRNCQLLASRQLWVLWYTTHMTLTAASPSSGYIMALILTFRKQTTQIRHFDPFCGWTWWQSHLNGSIMIHIIHVGYWRCLP